MKRKTKAFPFGERGTGVLFLLAGEKNEKNARPFRSIRFLQKVCFYTLLPTRVCTGFAVQATAEHAARAPSAADRFCACGRGLILRYLLMRAGLLTKNPLFPKQEKPSLKGRGAVREQPLPLTL